MNKELCFILDNKNIYLDHILVDYEYVPIFFLCKDDDCQYYLALCTDIENGEYIVVKISLLSVYNLLHGNIAMRDVILNQKIFWKVVSGDEIKNDIVNEYPIDYINHQDLPEKDAKFKILQKHIKAGCASAICGERGKRRDTLDDRKGCARISRRVCIGSLFQRNCHPCPFSGRTVLWLPDLGAADGRQPTVFIGDTGDENYGLSGYSLSRRTSGYKTSSGPDGILLSHD